MDRIYFAEGEVSWNSYDMAIAVPRIHLVVYGKMANVYKYISEYYMFLMSCFYLLLTLSGKWEEEERRKSE